MNNKSYVISVSAVSGGGKTAVTNELIKLLDDAAVLSFDGYDGDLLGRDYCEWSEDGANANEWHLEPLVNDIIKRISENHKYIIIDYPFGRSHEKVNKFIDFAVFIDVPHDISLARRIIRDYCRRNPDRKKIENPIEAIDKGLMFYLKRHRATYLQHSKTIQPYCDITVDGTKSIEDIAYEIIKTFTERFEGIVKSGNQQTV